MRLRLQPQHHFDVREVALVLRTVAAQDPDLAGKLPRPLKQVISLGCDVRPEPINVCFEPKEGLHASYVTRTLHDKFKVRDDSLRDDATDTLGGYLYAAGTRAFIFYETGHGEGFERFTIAHEAGHLFRELVPLLATARQGSLFEAPAEPKVVAARDTPGHLLRALDEPLDGDGSLLAEYQRHKAIVREKKADGFAAELLAPFGEVRRLVTQHPNLEPEHYVALLQERFKVSRKMARVRLAELSEDASSDQEILRLLD